MAGRGPRRTEEQDHPAMGETRHPTVSAQGPEDILRLYLRRHLPEQGQGRRPRHAPRQHGGTQRPPRRDRPHRRTRRPCPRHARPGRMAHLLDPRSARQYHPHAAPAPIPRTQPGRERLAVLARQLALKPRLPELRRHPRSLLQCLEQSRISASPHRFYRYTKMGQWVLNYARWYKIAILYTVLDFYWHIRKMLPV